MNVRRRATYSTAMTIVWLVIGLFLPWFSVGFEPHPLPETMYGWEYLLGSFSGLVTFAVNYGFDWFLLASALDVLSLLFLVAYICLNILRTVRMSTTWSHRGISIGLMLVAMTLAYEGQVLGPPVLLPLAGFWFFILGLLWSAVREWQAAIAAKWGRESGPSKNVA